MSTPHGHLSPPPCILVYFPPNLGIVMPYIQKIMMCKIFLCMHVIYQKNFLHKIFCTKNYLCIRFYTSVESHMHTSKVIII